MDNFFSQNVYFQDTDSLYIHLEYSEKLKEDGYVGNNLRQRTHHYGDEVGIFYGFFLASNLKFPFTVEKREQLDIKWLSTISSYKKFQLSGYHGIFYNSVFEVFSNCSIFLSC